MKPSLSDLVEPVKNSKYFFIFLSENYFKSPSTLLELHTALESGVTTCSIKVEGKVSLDFAQVKRDLDSDGIRSYMTAEGWRNLMENGVTFEQVREDLRKITNLKAQRFDPADYPQKVREIMIESLFDEIIE